ncbi:MAG: addiction module protein, partial [Bacteroidia bacterium]
MKVLLDIKDSKAHFVMELLRSLSFVKAEPFISEKTKAAKAIPDWHIAILQQRMQSHKANPKSVIDFDKAI